MGAADGGPRSGVAVGDEGEARARRSRGHPGYRDAGPADPLQSRSRRADPRKGQKARAYLTVEQVELLATLAGKHGTVVHFLAYSGTRWGEATGLRIRNFDPSDAERGSRRTPSRSSAGSTSAPRRPTRHAACPFRPFPRRRLGRRRPRQVAGPAAIRQRHHAPGATARGARRFAHAVAACRTIDPTFPVVTLHDLRHTAASLAVSAGANVESGAADARTRLGGDDPRHLRGPLRR